MTITKPQPPPNLRHLRAFLLVAEEGSVTAAAHKVFLTQPAVTQALRTLERNMGAPLFNRRNKRLYLTAAGALLRNRAARALDHIAGAARDIGLGQVDRRITTPQLQALIAVTEQRGFALAATAMGLAQPTVHRAARELERSLETAMFERTSHGVRPTRSADRFARKARLALAELAQARAEIAEHLGRQAGTTAIGAMPLARSHLVPRAISVFSRQHPGHDISIIEGPYENLLWDLRRGAIDFLVGAMREKLPVSDVVQETLFEDPISVIMRAGHPLAKTRGPSRKRLARFPWIAPRTGSPLRLHFDNLFASGDIEPPQQIIECNSLSASRVLLMDSDRLMLLSDAQTRYERDANMLISKPHPDGRIVREIGLTWRGDWQPTAAQQRLVDCLREQAALI